MPLPTLFLLLAFVVTLFAQNSAAGLDQAALSTALNEVLENNPTARRTTIALKVIDVASGKVLYDRHGDRLFTPASNLKIYTSACALDTFGPEHCFPTQITASVDGETRAIHGDLTIVGGGNAMLSSQELEKLADKILDEWKVKTLQGKVVVDNSRYSDTQLGPGWMWDDQPYYFNMRVTPLMVDFNVEKRIAVDDPQAWVAMMFTEMLRKHGVKIESPQANASPGTVRTLSFDGTKARRNITGTSIYKSENAVGEVLLHEIAIAGGIKRPVMARRG